MLQGRQALAALLAGVVALPLSGCRSTHRIVVPASPSEARAEALAVLEPGDTVRVRMKNGQERKIELRSVGAGALVAADGTEIRLEDIDSIERRQVSKGRTIALVSVVAGACFLLWAYAQVQVLAFSSRPPARPD